MPVGDQTYNGKLPNGLTWTRMAMILLAVSIFTPFWRISLDNNNYLHMWAPFLTCQIRGDTGCTFYTGIGDGRFAAFKMLLYFGLLAGIVALVIELMDNDKSNLPFFIAALLAGVFLVLCIFVYFSWFDSIGLRNIFGFGWLCCLIAGIMWLAAAWYASKYL